jgi:hypothetical protein
LLRPAETAERLGVYPLFQFADSPLQGERGVLRHLDSVLQALGERMAWEKALFLLTTHPRLYPCQGETNMVRSAAHGDPTVALV